MIIKRFEDIIAWRKARELVNHIYKVLKYNRDYSFKDQIQKAGVSIMNNIAEGYERKGNKEFNKFLYIAKGSCAEVRSMLYLGIDLKYYNQSIFIDLYSKSEEISKIISGLIKSL